MTPSGRRSRALVLAALLFAGIFALRVVRDDPDEVVTVLFALPVALVAVELGVVAGLAAGAFALGLFGIWDLAWSPAQQSLVDYASRGVLFIAIGGVTGALAARLRTVSADSERFWQLSSDLLCTAGFDGYLKRINPAWERTLGWTEDELRARPFVEFVHPDDRERTAAQTASHRGADVETLRFENRCACKDGGYRTIRWGARAITDDGLIYATGTDVTASTQARDELSRSEPFLQSVLENLPDTATNGTRILARMSHELRTPLNAIIGFSQLLELDELDKRQVEAVAQILGAGRHLLGLIDEVLDISRIEAGTMTLSLEPVHLASVVAEALSLIKPVADDAQVRLLGATSGYSELHALADQRRLKQVLVNLLSNAVKYNRAGGEASVTCAKLADGRIEIAVADTGVGMTAEQLTRVFVPFDRLGAECSDIEGTGLGLALSKGLTETMGGEIGAESEPGVGTTMRVVLAATSASPV